MDRNRSVVVGGALVLVGAWLLLRAVGVAPWGMGVLWPVVLILGGLVGLYSSLSSGESDGVWFSLMLLFSGPLFLYITLGAGDWSDMADLWPYFPLIAGVAWLVTWLFARGEIANLVLGLAALLVGALGFLYTYGYLAPETGQQLVQFWPLILVVLGFGYIVQYIIQSRHGADAGRD